MIESYIMNNRVIDLRRPDSKERETVSNFHLIQESVPATIKWKAPEYLRHAHSSYWFIGFGIMAVFLIIIGILALSYFFITFVALAYALMVLYAKREPHEITFALTKEGIQAGSSFHKFSDLKSFWIFKNEKSNDLSLETAKTISPFLRIPLGKMDPKEIQKFLKSFIPEKEHEELLTDHIVRTIGF